MKAALLCSGQGRQNRDMFAPFAQEEAARPILNAAAALLGEDIAAFLQRAEEDELHGNRVSQILCVTHGLAAAAALAAAAPFPDGLFVAGYSVGEVTAWGIAGVWPAADTLRIADARARAMDQAGGTDDGLGYVRGLARERLAPLLERFNCAIAIINPGGLFVIGGTRADVALLCAQAIEAGAAAAAPIPVRVASHTPRLRDAVAPFAAEIATYPASRPRLRLIDAARQQLVRDPAAKRDDLAAQIATMIDWAATLEELAARGVEHILELGPGSALARMAGEVSSNWQARSLEDFRSIRGAADWLFRRP